MAIDSSQQVLSTGLLRQHPNRPDSRERRGNVQDNIQNSSHSTRKGVSVVIDQVADTASSITPKKSNQSHSRTINSQSVNTSLSFVQQKALRAYGENQANSYLLDQEIEMVNRFDRYA